MKCFGEKKINALPFHYKVPDEKSWSKVAHFHQPLYSNKQRVEFFFSKKIVK